MNCKLYFTILILFLFVSIEARWLPGGKSDREWFYTSSTISSGDTLELRWKPSLDADHYDTLSEFPCDKYFVVISVVDKREDVSCLGKKINCDPYKTLFVKDLAPWYKRSLNNIFNSTCNNVESKQKFYLTCIIKDFLIIESGEFQEIAKIKPSTYSCGLTMEIQIKDADFKAVWEDSIVIQTVMAGTSFNQYIYNELISNSINSLAANILMNRLERTEIPKDNIQKE